MADSDSNLEDTTIAGKYFICTFLYESILSWYIYVLFNLVNWGDMAVDWTLDKWS